MLGFQSVNDESDGTTLSSAGIGWDSEELEDRDHHHSNNYTNHLSSSQLPPGVWRLFASPTVSTSVLKEAFGRVTGSHWRFTGQGLGTVFRRQVAAALGDRARAEAGFNLESFMKKIQNQGADSGGINNFLGVIPEPLRHLLGSND